MNLFRSEEHVRNWSSYNPEFEKTIKPITFWADLFSNLIFRSRGRSDFISWLRTDEARSAGKELRSKMP